MQGHFCYQYNKARVAGYFLVPAVAFVVPMFYLAAGDEKKFAASDQRKELEVRILRREEHNTLRESAGGALGVLTTAIAFALILGRLIACSGIPSGPST